MLARLEIVVGTVIVEETIIVSALPIFETFELNLSWLLFFSRLDFLPSVRNIAGIDCVEDIELQSPHHICGVLDIARLLERLEGNGLRVVRPIKTADDDKSGIGVALEFFELAHRVIDAEFG